MAFNGRKSSDLSDKEHTIYHLRTNTLAGCLLIDADDLCWFTDSGALSQTVDLSFCFCCRFIHSIVYSQTKITLTVPVLRPAITIILLFIIGIRLVAQDSIIVPVTDTVYLAPDTVVLENVVYIEYSGTPERYWSLQVGAGMGHVRYHSGSTSSSPCGNILLLRNEGLMSFGIGLNGTVSAWDHKLQQVRYVPYLHEETYTEVLDSFGKITGSDTIWTTVTRKSVRTVTDSTELVSERPARTEYRALGIPLQVGYEFKSGFLFARGYAAAEPGLLLSGGSKSAVLSAGAGIQASYLLHPHWALWTSALYMYQMTEIATLGGNRQTFSLSFGFSYIWGGDI